MTSRISFSRWRVVLLAAARLAALYVVVAALLLLPFLFLFEGPFDAVQDLWQVAEPLPVLFAIAFVLLAVARRSGLVVLWLLLGTLWAGLLRQTAVGHPDPTELSIAFVVWSILAIPLALIGGLGVPARLRVGVGPWKLTALALTLVLWAALLIPALALFVLTEFRIHPLDEAAAYRIAGHVSWFTWTPGALLIVLLSIAHVWVGTAPVKDAPPAA